MKRHTKFMCVCTATHTAGYGSSQRSAAGQQDMVSPRDTMPVPWSLLLLSQPGTGALGQWTDTSHELMSCFSTEES